MRHGRKHGKRAVAAAGRATGPKVIRRASEEYGGKRKAGAPLPECELEVAEKDAAEVWEFEAVVGAQHVQFSLMADSSIKYLHETEMLTYALLAACRQSHSQRPIDECWPITWIACKNEAAMDHFGDLSDRPSTPGMH